MTTTKSATPDHIIERNRCNAVASTGPQTDQGKGIARRNALKHGLCANPATGVVEDCDQFRQLHDAVAERYQPRDVIEAGLIHRIAVSLWRLQRATKIDSAISGINAQAFSPAKDRALAWIDRITNDFWLVEYVEVRDKRLIESRINQGLMQRGSKWHRVERMFLGYADKLREETLMKDGAAITAMSHLIQVLMSRLKRYPAFFGPVDAQMFAWLLGESAERLQPKEDAEDQRAVFYPDEQPWASRIDTLIGEARKRPEGEPISGALAGIVQVRLAALHTHRRLADDPYVIQQDENKQTATLLPDAATMDRHIRYETHADRSLHRSLEMLAKMRGATVESIAASITGPGPAGTTVEIHGQRTQWQSSGLSES